MRGATGSIFCDWSLTGASTQMYRERLRSPTVDAFTSEHCYTIMSPVVVVHAPGVPSNRRRLMHHQDANARN